MSASIRESEEYAAAWDAELWKAAEISRTSAQIKTARTKALKELSMEVSQQRDALQKAKEAAEKEAANLLAKARRQVADLAAREEALSRGELLFESKQRAVATKTRDEISAIEIQCAQRTALLESKAATLQRQLQESEKERSSLASLVSNLRAEIDKISVQSAEVPSLQARLEALQARNSALEAAVINCDQLLVTSIPVATPVSVIEAHPHVRGLLFEISSQAKTITALRAQKRVLQQRCAMTTADLSRIMTAYVQDGNLSAITDQRKGNPLGASSVNISYSHFGALRGPGDSLGGSRVNSPLRSPERDGRANPRGEPVGVPLVPTNDSNLGSAATAIRDPAPVHSGATSVECDTLHAIRSALRSIVHADSVGGSQGHASMPSSPPRSPVRDPPRSPISESVPITPPRNVSHTLTPPPSDVEISQPAVQRLQQAYCRLMSTGSYAESDPVIQDLQRRIREARNTKE